MEITNDLSLVLTSLTNFICCFLVFSGPGGDMQWCFSQVKGAIDDDVAEGMISATFSGAKRIGARKREPVFSFI